VRACARQIDVKRWAAQHHDELIGKQASLDAQMTELHRRKATLGMERAATIDYTKARARARAITVAINHEGTPHPTFPGASQNVALVVALLVTLSAPSTDRVGKVYQQLKGILGVAAKQQVESSLQRWAEVSVSSPGRSKASRQRTTTEHPAVGTASSLVRTPSNLRLGHPSKPLEPTTCRRARGENEGVRTEYHTCNQCHGRCNDREGHSLSPEEPGPKAFGSIMRDAYFPKHFWVPNNIVKYDAKTNPAPG
jgi:hypothetical protein